VRSDIEPGLLLRGERSRLARALGNLVDNALRHGSPPIIASIVEFHGGTLTTINTTEGADVKLRLPAARAG